jgi:hypothetical protein
MNLYDHSQLIASFKIEPTNAAYGLSVANTTNEVVIQAVPGGVYDIDHPGSMIAIPPHTV